MSILSRSNYNAISSRQFCLQFRCSYIPIGYIRDTQQVNGVVKDNGQRAK